MKYCYFFNQALLTVMILISSSAKADFQSTVNEIVKETKPYVKRLSQPIHIYSYTSRESVGLPNIGLIQSQDARFSHFINNKSKSFWEIEKQNMNAKDTDGLYAAIDPVVSRQVFGGKFWVLFRLQLPIGFDYLDLTVLNSTASRESFQPIRNQLSALGCDPESVRTFPHLFMKKISIECRRIALEALKALDVSSLLYDWQTLDFRDCKDRKSGAFVLLNLNQISSDEIQPFIAEFDSVDQLVQERLNIQALFNQVLGPANSGPSAGFSISKEFWPWPQLNQTAKTLDLKGWLRETMMYCQ